MVYKARRVQAGDEPRSATMSSIDTTTITVTGMTCAHCVRSVSEELAGVEGVEDVAVDLGTGRVTLRTSAPVEAAALRAAVEEAGYEVGS